MSENSSSPEALNQKQPAAALEAEGSSNYKWHVLFTVIFGTFMVILDATAVNVAIPNFRDVFAENGQKAALDAVDGIITAYLLALGIITPLAGYLADRFGIKRVYLISLGFFVGGSALCSLAPSLGWLIAFRAVQGLGGGILVPLGTSMLINAFPERQRGLAFGIFGIPLIVAPASGPVLGGYFVEYLTWHYIFLVNIPVGLVGILLGALWLREGKRVERAGFDFLGIIFSVISFGTLLYAIQRGSSDGWGSLTIVSLLVIGIVSFLLMVIVELRSPNPLLDIRLFARPIFAGANIVTWVSVIALFGAEFLLPLYLQTLRGQSPLQAGLLVLPLALAAGVTSPFAGILYNKIGARWLIFIGGVLLAINTWNLAEVTLDTPFWYLMVIVAIRGLAIGLIQQTTINASYTGLKPEQMPRASSLSTALRNVFQSFGVAVLGTIISVRTTTYMDSARSDLLNPATELGKQLVNAVKGMLTQNPHMPQIATEQAILGKLLGAQFPSSFLHALNDGYWLCFWLSVLMVLLAFTLPGPRHQQKDVPAQEPAIES